tara:strand:+ start:1711 stop:2808 length:1098 start_codon:yes stop_codon:yes gene_type:complete
MPIAQQFPETLYIDVKIDGNKFPYATSAKIKHSVNSARALSCSFIGKEPLEMCRLGAVVEFNWSRGNLNNLQDDKTFIGIIKDIKPGRNLSTFTALDYTTFLAESQYELYKSQDYIGTDLYFAAAQACDYKGIDTSRLIGGSGILITKEMDLFGWKTRKEFIDACFDEMKRLVNDDRHPKNTIRQWQYAIKNGKIMDFFYPDPDNTINYPYVTLSVEKGNIIDEDLVSNIDTTRLVNAITVVSKDDDNTFFQLEDAGSQDRYGIVSKFLKYPSNNKSELENVAYRILNRFKEPTVSYSVSLTNKDNLDLGDLVEIDMPSLPESDIKTVVGYETSLSDSVLTRYAVGQTKVSFKEYLDLLKEPIDR